MPKGIGYGRKGHKETAAEERREERRELHERMMPKRKVKVRHISAKRR